MEYNYVWRVCIGGILMADFYGVAVLRLGVYGVPGVLGGEHGATKQHLW